MLSLCVPAAFAIFHLFGIVVKQSKKKPIVWLVCEHFLFLFFSFLIFISITMWLIRLKYPPIGSRFIYLFKLKINLFNIFIRVLRLVWCMNVCVRFNCRCKCMTRHCGSWKRKYMYSHAYAAAAATATATRCVLCKLSVFCVDCRVECMYYYIYTYHTPFEHISIMLCGHLFFRIFRRRSLCQSTFSSLSLYFIASLYIFHFCFLCHISRDKKNVSMEQIFCHRCGVVVVGMFQWIWLNKRRQIFTRT